jgi:Kdo2-lipid IVA lauroyltransferase/acyltransferase
MIFCLNITRLSIRTVSPNPRANNQKNLQHPCQIPAIEYGAPRLQHRLEVLPLWGINFIFKVCPSFLSRRLAKVLSNLAYRCIPKKVNESLAQIQQHLNCSEDKAEKILRSSFQHFALNWVAQVSPSKVFSETQIRYEGLEKLHEANAQGRGTVIAAMHLGLWEAIPYILKKIQVPVAIVVAVQHNPLCDKIFNELRSAQGYHIVLHNRLGVRHLLKYLKQGGTVVILSDVDIGGSGLALPFLGSLASTPSWPAELAHRTGAQMLIGYTTLCESQITAHLEDLPEIAETENNNPNVVRSMCLAMNNSMSKIVQQYPEQWFWMQRRWKTPVERLKN